MFITDKIYGKVEINDPAILELLKTKVLLRIDKIAQFGLPDKYYHIKGYSRLEHSIGVMILLRKLGASLEEQVAGLLHDISHTAFSHTVDWVLGSSKDENFQDKRQIKFAKDSELKNILEKYKMNPDKILDLSKFSLLDSEIPDLCADRVDYALREFLVIDSRKCLKHLTVFDGKIVFNDPNAAFLFAMNFISLQMNHWGEFEAVNRWFIFAEMLKRAIKLKIIEFGDFYQDDKFVIDKLEESSDEKIISWLNLVSEKSLKNYQLSKKKQIKKFRYVNPEFIENGTLIRVTKEFPKFAEILEKARKENKKGIPIVRF